MSRVHRGLLGQLAATAILIGAPVMGQTAATVAVAAPRRKIDQQVSARADGTVQVNNVSGTVVIQGWSRDKVKVTGTLGAGARRLDVRSTGSRTKIHVVGPEHSGRMEGTDLEIKVPSGSKLNVVTVAADVTVTVVNGSFEIKTVSGRVKASGKPPEVDVTTVSGQVETVAGSRGTRMKSVSGNLTATGKTKNLVMKTVSGKLTSHSPLFQRCELGSVSGSIAINGGLGGPGPIHLKSHSGDVTLELARAVKGAFDLSTFSGSIRSDLGGEVKKSSGPGKSLTFEQGSGGPDVVVRTFSGNVKLRTK